MSMDTDEDEHSLEMQLPYIAMVMERMTKNLLEDVPSLKDIRRKRWLEVPRVHSNPTELLARTKSPWDSLEQARSLVPFYTQGTSTRMPMFRRGDFSIVPILVGSLSPDKEQYYGNLLSRYLTDPDNLFIISSDFCHWGRRFHYTYYDKRCGEICQSIAALDKMGMNIIEKMKPLDFSDYLAQYQNTICGRHPIAVLLNAIESIRKNGNGYKMNFKFLKYSQSSECTCASDSSVSYAAGYLYLQ